MIIYLIEGMPKNGKTTISNEFECSVISLDELFLQYYNNLTLKENRYYFSVCNDWIKILKKDKEHTGKFFQWINKELELYIKDRELVVEGWLLKYYSELIIEKYKSRHDCFKVEVKNYSCYIDDICFYNDNINLIKQNIVYPIKEYCKKHIVDNLFVNYHYFEDINIGNKKQQSLKKYNLFNLEGVIKDKSVLDIGCNTGYNVLKISKDANSVVGIDINRNAIITAEKINNIFYQKKNVQFYERDIFDCKEKYDVILASSLFHYFVGKQKEFIDKCYDILNNDGVLILECGITEGEKQSLIMKRSDGSVCEYPTEKTLINYNTKFSIVYQGTSVIQGGDSIPRYVYHLKK